MAKVPTSLLKGLSGDERKVVAEQFERSQKLVKQLRKLIKDDIESRYAEEELDIAEYISYPHNVALLMLGERRGLRSVLKYIPEENKDE